MGKKANNTGLDWINANYKLCQPLTHADNITQLKVRRCDGAQALPAPHPCWQHHPAQGKTLCLCSSSASPSPMRRTSPSSRWDVVNVLKLCQPRTQHHPDPVYFIFLQKVVIKGAFSVNLWKYDSLDDSAHNFVYKLLKNIGKPNEAATHITLRLSTPKKTLPYIPNMMCANTYF